jgi:spermidine/putrescine-binding protein
MLVQVVEEMQKWDLILVKGLTFSEAKKTKMEKVTVEGADLAKEIAKKVNEDFDQKKLPLMLGMINAIVDDKKLELDWESFR